jgi:hypothetical protein
VFEPQGAALARLARLEHLDLRHTQGLEAAGLPELVPPTLRSLRAGPRLDPEAVVALLGRAAELRELTLLDSRLRPDAVAALTRTTGLRRLTLDGCAGLDASALEALAALELEQLSLRDVRLPRGAVAALQARRPACRILAGKRSAWERGPWGTG